MGCICKKVTSSTGSSSTADKSQNSTDSTQNSTVSNQKSTETVLNGPNSTVLPKKSTVSKPKSTVSAAKKPPNNKGKRTGKVAIKMRTAIINRTVEPKGTVLVERFGGSKGTAQRVLQQLVTEKVLYQDPKSKRYKHRSSMNG